MALDCTGGHSAPSIDWSRSRLDLWRSFCQRYRVGEESVPLFECDESGFVLSKEIGTARRRKILQRSSAMEALMRREAKTAAEDHKAAIGLYDGIIYLMHTRGSDGGVVSCYIGKAETVGKTSGVLSANLMRIATDTSKFGRWASRIAWKPAFGDKANYTLVSFANDGHFKLPIRGFESRPIR